MKKILAITSFWKRNVITRYIWKKTRFANIVNNSSVFRTFLKEHISLTRLYRSMQELTSDIPQADLYITGSDQVWNSDYTLDKKPDLPFYLAFLPDDCKRISYASSFGKNDITEEEKRIIQPLLKKYSALSVREDSAKTIINDMGINATVVCDPTLLCNPLEYDKIIGDTQILESDYVLLFMIGFDKKLYSIANDFCKLPGKELVVILPDCYDKNKCRGKA